MVRPRLHVIGRLGQAQIMFSCLVTSCRQSACELKLDEAMAQHGLL